MNTQVNEELCVGCGLCVDVCPDIFVMNDDKAKAKTNSVPQEAQADCKKAQEACPVEAIVISE